MIRAVVLAAGQSRRMGAHKMLLPYGGKTVIAHVVDELARSSVADVVVVVGHEGERVTEALAGLPATVVANDEHEAGMLSSVRCGLRALGAPCEAVMVALGDQPGVTSELADGLTRAFAATDKGIVVPVCDGKWGHPLLFSNRHCPEVLGRFGNVGLRGLLRAHPDDILELAVPDAAALSDMDYPEDYHEALARLEAQARQ